MRGSENPRVPGNCYACGCRSGSGSFCTLPEPAYSALRSIKATQVYSRGATIFMEGQPAQGVYLLCSGRAKLTTCSEDGKAIILRIAEPGEALGLSAVFTNRQYENTAQTIEGSTVTFIEKRDFLSFIEAHHDAALIALRQLSNNYHKAYLQICSLGLSSSAGDKLAKLLLQWCGPAANGGQIRIARRHTHSEIAEMIGCSRETVTRLLADFKGRGLVDLSRTELLIPDRDRLRAAIGTRYGSGYGNGSVRRKGKGDEDGDAIRTGNGNGCGDSNGNSNGSGNSNGNGNGNSNGNGLL